MFSSPSSLALVTLAFFIILLSATLTLTGAANLGVAYGRNGNNLPSPREVVDLYRSQGIRGMRIYDPDQNVLQALRGSGIELLLGVPNTDLQQLASDIPAAKRWVQTNVLNYYPNVNIRYISVGNEVTPVNANSRYANFVVPAMTNIFNAVKDAGLFQKVLVSTALDTSVIDEKTSYPPSAGNFRGDVMWFMNPIIGFLTDTNQPIMFSIYPYYAIGNPNIKRPFVLFQNQSPEFIDNGLAYYNLFDAMLDGVYSALEKNSGPAMSNGFYSQKKQGYNVKAVVVETGYKRSGRPPAVHGRRKLLASDDACTYNQNLIQHVTSSRGTPKRPGVPIVTYIFAMFDENMKPEAEKNFGLFDPTTRQPFCPINFHGT